MWICLEAMAIANAAIGNDVITNLLTQPTSSQTVVFGLWSVVRHLNTQYQILNTNNELPLFLSSSGRAITASGALRSIPQPAGARGSSLLMFGVLGLLIAANTWKLANVDMNFIDVELSSASWRDFEIPHFVRNDNFF